MQQDKITDLPEIETVAPDDVLEITDVSASTSNKVNIQSLAHGVLANFGSGDITSEMLGDSGWQNLTPASGYVTSSAKYRRIGNLIYLKGQVNISSGNVSFGDTIADLPAGYRPAGTHIFIGVGSGASFFKGLVSSSGQINIASAPAVSTTYVWLDNIIFEVSP